MPTRSRYLKSYVVDKFDIIAKNQNGILNIGFITAVQLNKNNFERFVNIISYYSGDEKRKYGSAELTPLDDAQENQANEYIVKRFVKE